PGLDVHIFSHGTTGQRRTTPQTPPAKPTRPTRNTQTGSYGPVASSFCLMMSSGWISPLGIGGGFGTLGPAFSAGTTGALPASGGCCAIRSVWLNCDAPQPP